MPKEVGCEHFLQAVSSDPVLLRQDALTCRKHADNVAVIETTQMCERGTSRIEAKYLKTSNAPGEETSEKGFPVKMWVWHDACVQVETVQPVVPATGKQMSSSLSAEASVKTGCTWRKTNKITLNFIVLCVVSRIHLILNTYVLV